MITEIRFDREKLAAYCKVSNEFINETNIEAGSEGIDYALEMLTIKMESFIVSRLAEKQKVFVTAERPTFFRLVTEAQTIIHH